MARPKKGYQNNEEKRVAGVTSVLNWYGDKGGIIYAANKLGLEGKTIRDEWYTKAANTGTLGHDFFEQYLHKQLDMEPIEIDLDSYTITEITGAETARDSAIRWFENTHLEIIWTEMPLVSEKMQIGGTPDALGVDAQGNYVIADWKTGGVYGSALFQVAAYKILVEENLPDVEIKGFHVVRFAKDTGDFVHRYYPELDKQVEAYPQMVKLFRLMQETEKRAK